MGTVLEAAVLGSTTGAALVCSFAVAEESLYSRTGMEVQEHLAMGGTIAGFFSGALSGAGNAKLVTEMMNQYNQKMNRYP